MTIAAAAGVFVLADLIYALDHYFVHRNDERYWKQHHPHHTFYRPGAAAAKFMPNEFARYTWTGMAAVVVGGLLSWFTGNPGFVIGGALKWAHNYLFHLYQHRWAYRNPAASSGPPRATWGIASARYHRYHHDHPQQRPFTYAETWAGWDRLLEIADPVLVRCTANHRRRARVRRQGARSS